MASRRRIPVDATEPAGERLLFVGDSVTFGFGVLAEESYGYRVGEVLDDAAGVAVAAVPGYNLEQVIGALRRELATRKPELVIYGLVLNDVYGTPRPLTYEDIAPHASRIAEGGFPPWSAGTDRGREAAEASLHRATLSLEPIRLPASARPERPSIGPAAPTVRARAQREPRTESGWARWGFSCASWPRQRSSRGSRSR